ncbi:hypothetical protein [Alteromonas stellipolaris]|uniref:hypothetical protein n=1 Tax=Alteromonas stellipolaris TaxID=233316 RepID=UPI002733DC22|nr:hypothetical protein [Alteromonas stellipolaris]MDP2537946.1 hypothetical protein [Alteromonas stellipolaris]
MKFDLSNMSAAELDELIKSAAVQRIKTQMPHDKEPGVQVDATYNPAWRAVLTEQNLLLLHLCKPGYGWQSFAFPETEIKNLYQTLSKVISVSENISKKSGSKH